MTKDQLGVLILDAEGQMYCTARTILGNDEDCADAIQETIVKAFQKIDTLKKDKYAKTWLMRILINECYNLTRINRKSFAFLPHFEYNKEKRWRMCLCYLRINMLTKSMERLPVMTV